jgi:hypothetical protein
VVAQTSDPRATAASAVRIMSELFGGSTPRYEGFYFEVVDASGNLVLVQSSANRTGAGRDWVEPSVQDVSSIQTSHPVSTG